MNDESNKTDPVPGDEFRVSDDDRAINSLASCSDDQVCSAHASVTRANIQIAMVTAYTGIAVSTIFAIALLVVYVSRAMVGLEMQPPPWYIVDTAMALFATGAISAIKIPRRYRHDRQD